MRFRNSWPEAGHRSAGGTRRPYQAPSTYRTPTARRTSQPRRSPAASPQEPDDPMLPYYQTPHDVTHLPAWQLLVEHRQAMHDFSLRQAFAADPQRFARFSVDSCGLFLDYSKNLITEQTIDLLMRLAREAGLQQSIEALLDGQPVNASEGRPALHTALRRPVG